MKMKIMGGSIIGLVILCTVGVLWLGKGAAGQALTLDIFQNEKGQYEYGALPFTCCVGEVEKILDVNLKQADFAQGATSNYSLPGIYRYNDVAVQTNLEFCDEKLQMISFSIETNSNDIEQQFAALSSELVSLYGKPTETMDNSGALGEPFGGTVSCQGMKWSALDDESTTMLQVMMMCGDTIQPNLSIIIGVVPQS